MQNRPTNQRSIFYLFSLFVVALLAYLIGSNAPARSVRSERKDGGSGTNVILISIDSLRADHLGCYGYQRKTSPNLDRLASEGVLFSNAFSTSSWTLPTHLSMLTSLYSQSHGVLTGSHSLDPNRTTLAEVLKKEGYATAAFVSAPYVDSIYGFAQGFDLYDDSINGTSATEKRHGHKLVTSPQLHDSIVRWLGGHYQKNFFLFLHYFDVHYDYVPPPPFDTMFDPEYSGSMDGKNYARNRGLQTGANPADLAHIIALYDGEIAFVDKYLGELFAALKKLELYDRTLIVLTADHGEEFFEHGRKGHRHSLYDEVLRVPLILKLPDHQKQNTKIQTPVSIVDIMPTVLTYLGIESPAESQGRNLFALAEDEDSKVYARLENKLVAVRSSRSKLIRNLKHLAYEFYDLRSDNGEQRNLLREASIADLPDAKNHLVPLFNWLNRQWHVSQTLPKAKKNNRIELDEGMQEQLEALGYAQ